MIDMQKIIEVTTNGLKNKYNYLAYVIVFVYIIENVILFYSEAVNSGIAYWMEIGLFFVVFAFGCIYNRIDFEVRIQPVFLIAIFWGIWVLSYLKWDMTMPVDIRLFILGLVSLSWVLIRFSIDIIKSRSIIFYYIKRNIHVFIVILVCIGLIFPTVYDVCFYDCGQYYEYSIYQMAPHTFDYSLTSIHNYCLCNHTTTGFSIFVLLGELINKYYGFKLANYLLFLISVYFFYKCIQKLTGVSEIISTLATSVYAFSPWCMGLIGQTSIDNPSLYFIPILLYAYLYKRDVLFLLIGWLFLNTKEPNILYYSLFVFTVWVLFVVDNAKETNNWSIGAVYKLIKKGVYLVFPSIMWLIMYSRFASNGSWTLSVSGSDTDIAIAKLDAIGVTKQMDIKPPIETYVHTLGFTFDNFVQKMKEMFIYNFSWLWILIAIIAVLVYFKKEGGIGSIGHIKDVVKDYIPICVIAISIAVFNWVYLDWDNPRYVMPMTAPLLMITLSCIVRVIKKFFINSILVFGAILMLVQSFIFIDPSMVAMSKYMSHKDEGMYNRNYRALYTCLNEIMRDIDWDEDYISIRLGEGLCSYGEKLYYDRNKKRVTILECDDSIEISYRIDGECDYYVYDLSKEDIPEGMKEVGKYSYTNLYLGVYH